MSSGGNSFTKASFQVEMDLYKVQKQGRDENKRAKYPTTERWWKRKTILPSTIFAADVE